MSKRGAFVFLVLGVLLVSSVFSFVKGDISAIIVPDKSDTPITSGGDAGVQIAQYDPLKVACELNIYSLNDHPSKIGGCCNKFPMLPECGKDGGKQVTNTQKEVTISESEIQGCVATGSSRADCLIKSEKEKNQKISGEPKKDNCDLLFGPIVKSDEEDLALKKKQINEFKCEPFFMQKGVDLNGCDAGRKSLERYKQEAEKNLEEAKKELKDCKEEKPVALPKNTASKTATEEKGKGLQSIVSSVIKWFTDWFRA